MAHARDYLALGEKEPHWDMMRALWASVAELTVVQAQDILALGSEGRMNTPSTVGTNWRWRVTEAQLSDELRKEILTITKRYGRMNWDAVEPEEAEETETAETVEATEE